MLKQNEIQRVIDEAVVRIISQLGQNQSVAGTADRVLQDRVITTFQVPDKLDNNREVVVRQDAVITPAAYDLFRDRGLRVRRLAVESTNMPAVGIEGRFLKVGYDGVISGQMKLLLGPAEAFESVVEASAQTSTYCESGHRVVMVAAEPELAVIALSRHSAVRPVEVLSVDQPALIERRCDSTSANVLVLAACLGGHWRIGQVAEKFLQQQYTKAPAGI